MCRAVPTWVADPTAMPMASSMRFLMAMVTAVMCSVALPTMGSKITPTNTLDT